MIDRNEFETWHKAQEIEYASRSIPRKHGSSVLERLRFIVLLTNSFRVTLGLNTIYEGNSFQEAQAAYNELSNRGN